MRWICDPHCEPLRVSYSLQAKVQERVAVLLQQFCSTVEPLLDSVQNLNHGEIGNCTAILAIIRKFVEIQLALVLG